MFRVTAAIFRVSSVVCATHWFGRTEMGLCLVAGFGYTRAACTCRFGRANTCTQNGKGKMESSRKSGTRHSGSHFQQISLLGCSINMSTPQFAHMLINQAVACIVACFDCKCIGLLDVQRETLSNMAKEVKQTSQTRSHFRRWVQ